MEYIGRLYCCKYNEKNDEKNDEKNKNKMERKKRLESIMKTKRIFSEIFIISLPLFYKGYIEKKYAPGGKGYEKTEKHFKVTANEQNLNKK
jgi:hypothetical protein